MFATFLPISWHTDITFWEASWRVDSVDQHDTVFELLWNQRFSYAYCVRVTYSFSKTSFYDITPHLVSQSTKYVIFFKGKLYVNKGLPSRYSLEFCHVMIWPPELELILKIGWSRYFLSNF